MLPDCLDLRGANLRIVADQWHGESNSGGSDDSVRQVGHLVTRYTSQSIGDCAVEWNQRTRTRRIIQRLNKCFPHDSRQAMFLDQIGELNETDRRNENGIARSRCAVEGLSRPYREPGIILQVPDDGVGIDYNAGHQMSSLGKFFHISRWFSSISSAEREIPRPAHRPLTLLNGGFLAHSARRRLAWS